MNKLIPVIFEILARAFDTIPILKELRGYRSAIGFFILALMHILANINIISPETLSQILPYLLIFTGLALNASGRELREPL